MRHLDSHGLDVSVWPAEIDDALVVQVDTGGRSGRLRINVNDAPVYDANPETNEGEWPCLYSASDELTHQQRITLLLEYCQEAANASFDDSNDDEIEALQDALGQALTILGLEMPEGKEVNDD